MAGPGPDTRERAPETRPGGHLPGPGPPNRRRCGPEAHSPRHGPGPAEGHLPQGALGIAASTMNTTREPHGPETECTARDLTAGPIAAFAARYRRGDVSAAWPKLITAPKPPEPELSPSGNGTDNRCISAGRSTLQPVRCQIRLCRIRSGPAARPAAIVTRRSPCALPPPIGLLREFYDLSYAG